MSTRSSFFAAGPGDILDPELSAKLIENLHSVAANAATLSNEQPQARVAAANSPGIPPDTAPVLISTANDLSQLAADYEPIHDEIPQLSFSLSGPQIVYHVGNQDLNERQLHQHMFKIPAGQVRVDLYKLYIRGKKYMCHETRFDLDLIRSLGLYDDVRANISPVLKKAEADLLEWGRTEDLLNGNPRAKTLAKIAGVWGAFVCDHFRSSNERARNLRVIASAARSVPDYTIAHRLVNENILVRLEKATRFHYRRKRYATIADWYGIRGMALIHEPIDPPRLFAVQMHLGEFDVLEEGIV